MAEKMSVEAILSATDKNYSKTMENAGKKMQEFDKKTKVSMDQIGKSMKDIGGKMTKFLTVPAVGAVTAVVKSYADLEQAVGGIETMFKGSADKVIKNSETAYKRAGVSGVKYMEEVTSFSARLLQGLGGDTEKAARYADMAMVDMSDNANKFGTNIGSIQDAYQGFAKQNYTMLDNLKLGYGGTASEMARLINDSGVLGDTMTVTADNLNEIDFHTMVEAIHVVQDEMGITGTTALEAEETVSGSFGMMKAALQDLAAGFGDSGADIERLLGNLFDSIGVFVGNVTRVLGNIWDNLPLENWQKWTGAIILSAGPILSVVGNLIGIFAGLKTGLGQTVAEGLANSSMTEVLGSAFGALNGPILVIIGAIAAVVAVLVYLYQTNDEFKEKVNNVWEQIQNLFETVTQIISDILTQTFESLSEWWNENQERFFAVVEGVWTAISDFFIAIFEAIGGIIQSIWEPISAWWIENQELILDTIDIVWNLIADIFMTVMEVIGGVIETGFNYIAQVVEFVMPYVQTFIEGVMGVILNIISLVMGIIRGDWETVWESIKGIVKGVWNAIKGLVQTAISAVLSILVGVLTTIQTAWSAAWSLIWGVVKDIWKAIKSTIQNYIEGAKNVISTVLSTIKTIVTDKFNQVKTTTTNIWNNIKDAIMKPITKAKDKVKEMIDRIKGFMDFKWELPKLKMPHFSFSGKFSLNPPSVPKFGVDWYAKGGIMNTPTMFGMNGNNAMVGGEAGPEAILPLNERTLGDIGKGIANTMETVMADNNNQSNVQPAYINLTMGGRTYSAFVGDITNKQNNDEQAELTFS